jgi:zinc protease
VKRALLFPIAVLLLMIGLGANVQLGAQQWKQIPIPKLPEFNPPKPKRIQLANGMVIFLQEDHELPLIDGTARIRGGALRVPANKAGMMDVYGEAWRTGGTKTQTGDQLDDLLEQRAAKVETGATGDSTTIGFSCLKEDFADVFRVFDDVLRNPEFRADKIEIAKKGEYDSIARRNDEALANCGARSGETRVYGATVLMRACPNMRPSRR